MHCRPSFKPSPFNSTSGRAVKSVWLLPAGADGAQKRKKCVRDCFAKKCTKKWSQKDGYITRLSWWLHHGDAGSLAWGLALACAPAPAAPAVSLFFLSFAQVTNTMAIIKKRGNQVRPVSWKLFLSRVDQCASPRFRPYAGTTIVYKSPIHVSWSIFIIYGKFQFAN